MTTTTFFSLQAEKSLRWCASQTPLENSPTRGQSLQSRFVRAHFWQASVPFPGCVARAEVLDAVSQSRSMRDWRLRQQIRFVPRRLLRPRPGLGLRQSATRTGSSLWTSRTKTRRGLTSLRRKRRRRRRRLLLFSTTTTQHDERTTSIATTTTTAK